MIPCPARARRTIISHHDFTPRSDRETSAETIRPRRAGEALQARIVRPGKSPRVACPLPPIAIVGPGRRLSLRTLAPFSEERPEGGKKAAHVILSVLRLMTLDDSISVWTRRFSKRAVVLSTRNRLEGCQPGGASVGLAFCREPLERRPLVSVLHRGHVEIHRFEVADREQREL